VTLGGVNLGDRRDRPVILRTEPPPAPARLRRTILGMTAIAILTTASAAAGSWSIWSVVGSTSPSGTPTPPLWFTPEHTLSTLNVSNH